MYTGIDYGLGQANIDHTTGIRYGVISASGDILQAWADSSEPDYGEPTCPDCGNTASPIGDVDVDTSDWDCAKHECADYACVTCKHVFGSESAFGEEPMGFTLDDGEYTAQSCLDSDVMIMRSPYFTYAPFCSPCVPGACSLDSTDGRPESGVKAYCFGHDWFDNGVDGPQHAPYVVYSIETGEVVES